MKSTVSKAGGQEHLRFVIACVALIAYCVTLEAALAWYCWHLG